jgi:hypothetical protein
MYSASVVERETQFCFLEDQHTKDLPRNWQAPNVDFRSILSPAQSKSQYAQREKSVSLGYHNRKSGVSIKYQKILLTAIKWLSFGAAWYRAQTPTLNIVWTGCAKIEQQTYHGAVKLLVHWFPIGVVVVVAFQGHRSSYPISILHLEALEHVLNVLGLVDEGFLTKLLDLKSKEELELSHHGHLEPIHHQLGKLLIKGLVSRPKDYIVHIELAYEKLLVNPISKKSGIEFPNLEATVYKKLAKMLIPRMWGLFKSHRAAC